MLQLLTRSDSQETGDRSQESAFFLPTSPRPHVPTSPLPHFPNTQHPTLDKDDFSIRKYP
ncbi:MAG: hypothetical protein EWV82_15460 [Microcystis aeruginosa Ma_AC_P_19900807_S299]|nr:MAG: hypothetical protein EWV82_15460 [Microcystis aeruginosa Ma_AC_P_19900807_S299]